MNLNELIRERDGLISLLDLLMLMKPFDTTAVYDFATACGLTMTPDETERMSYGGNIQDVLKFCKKMGFKTTAEVAQEYVDIGKELDALLAKDANTPKDENGYTEVRAKYGELMRAVHRNLGHDLRNLKCMYIEATYSDLWDNLTKDWEDVIAVLDDPKHTPRLTSSTVEEQVNEAGRCLAMGRGTACVMHLNNILELGLLRMRRKLPPRFHPGKKNELDDWIAAVNIYTQSTPTPSDAPQWASVSGRCSAVRTAWRHPAVHADMIFTEEMASEIYPAVRSLMKDVIKL